jgi:hypothetical protein
MRITLGHSLTGADLSSRRLAEIAFIGAST